MESNQTILIKQKRHVHDAFYVVCQTIIQRMWVDFIISVAISAVSGRSRIKEWKNPACLSPMAREVTGLIVSVCHL